MASNQFHTRCLHGFSIMQAMIGMAIMGIAAAGFMTFLNTVQKGQKNVQNAVDFDITMSRLSLLLSSKACDGAFQDATHNEVQLFSTAPTGTGELLASSVNIKRINSTDCPLKKFLTVSRSPLNR